MEKQVWVVGEKREDLIAAQRAINATGSMRAFCMVSFVALKKSVEMNKIPSLIILDYEMEKAGEFQILRFLQSNAAYAGIPLFFMVEKRDEKVDEECYEKGAIVVLSKPFSKASVLRIERTAWQQEMTKSYEGVLVKQAHEIEAAKEMERLNKQLSARNALLQQVFGQYFSDEVVQVILDNPEGAALGGGKKEIVVMFTDLRGFTALTELLSSEQVTQVINQYLGEMTECVMEYGGTVIEFVGDGILAVFGAPVPSETAIEDAIAAAIQMQNKMPFINENPILQGCTQLEMGIGIHQGEVFIGNIGSEKMMRYNVIGREVNLCSRIESYSVGGQILVSKESIEPIRHMLDIEQEYQITAKGIQHPVTICDVKGIHGKYNCQIEQKEETWIEIDEKITVQMYPMKEKQVEDIALEGRLKGISEKCAKVMIDTPEVFSLYENIKVKMLDLSMYGKVILIEEDSILLHFTYVTSDYEMYLDSLKKKCH